MMLNPRYLFGIFNFKTGCIGALIFVAIAAFYLMVFKFSVNIPFVDDYDVVLNFVNQFQAASLKDKLVLILSQHNEHRMVILRLFAVMSAYFFGSIDFRYLIIIGNLGLLGLAAIIFKSFSLCDERVKLAYFIPVVFILFQPRYWEAVLWVTPLFSLVWVILFAFLALYLLAKRNPGYFSLSLLVAAITVYTNGNGMFVFLSGAYSLICQKRKKELIVWSVFSGIVSCLYLYGYVKPAHHPSISGVLMVNLLGTLLYLLGLLGSSVVRYSVRFYGISFVVSLSAGALILTCLFFLVKIKYNKKNPLIFSFLSFIFLSSLANALTRSGLGFEYALKSRYSILSVLLIVLLYLSMTEVLINKERMRKYSLAQICVFLSLFYCLSSYCINFNSVFLRRAQLIQGLNQWKITGAGILYPDEKRVNSILLTAIENKTYSFPQEGN